MDRGARWATVQGLQKNWTQLNNNKYCFVINDININRTMLNNIIKMLDRIYILPKKVVSI